ncbi:Exodeoxyribonuclease 7 large subunit [Symmachiella dynata]|nr:Exodeoxyribonuclease 7 large subunit [Symmachiella dynata]
MEKHSFAPINQADFAMPDVPLKTVSQLTQEIKNCLEIEFPFVWVSGEISNLSRAASGHCYLTLKDDSAQLRAIMWRGTANRLKFDLHDGLEVVAAGRVEVYEARGSYQLIIEQCEPQGLGALELAFRQLHEKLAGEGLFDPEHKQPLPAIPQRIALVTSPTSAAVRDMLQVLTRRWPAAEILILPVLVQGPGAAAEIAAALRSVPQIPGVDVVITGRGGGSLEDLWAFNEEIVARAIYDCPIPVVSAVGHEIDVTIADLVADRRALTPSEAAELVVPDVRDIRAGIAQMRNRLISGLKQQAVTARRQLDALASRRVFTQPAERIHDLQQLLDELEARNRRAVQRIVETAKQQLASSSASLDALSPLAVLGRGYSLSKIAGATEFLKTIDDAPTGATLQTLLADGRVISKIESTDAGQPQDFLE